MSQKASWPEYSIVSQKVTDEIDGYILEIKSRNESTIIKKSLSEISKDRTLIAKFNPIDANRIGYMAGVLETAMEYRALLTRRQPEPIC